ncbi:MAG: oxidoreductase [Gammaproteobacteria bacterium RIFCSPLOWO2_02_FULL_61_13]|nr:MAG: oxidoreductase [Gammaproteobacteria bacterium RIFCSPLOWO2_02_FULL_61_13]
MQYRTLGASGARVSEICLGAMTFGEADEKSFMHKIGASEEEAHHMMSHALEAGVNFWDTANVYGQDGLSERVIGSWFKKSGRRHDVVLATKCRFGMGPGPNDRGATRLHIKRAVDESLKRLGTDCIDLFQIHMQDIKTPEEEVVRALDELTQAGKIHYSGASNYAAYRLVEHLWAADRARLNRYVTLQAQYNLLERGLELEHVPACKRWGLGLLPWSPLAGGFLTGKYQRDKSMPGGTRYEKMKDRFESRSTDRNWAIVDTVVAVAKELNATPTQVSLAWLLRKPAVTSVIIGARSVVQLEDSLKAVDLVLPDAAMERLDKVSAPQLFYPYDFMKNIDGGW